MRLRTLFVVTLLSIYNAGAYAQLTPLAAVVSMGRGINVGNSFDAPTETSWGNPPIQESYFDAYKNAGFTAVRMPVTWGGHTSLSIPYAIDSTYLSRVEQVVDWGLARGLVVVLDAHHESWLKEALADTSTDLVFADSCMARFDSIWSQIATRFKDKSDSLVFEMLNEPYPMSASNVDKLNAQVLKIIRRTNPTRIVVFSGYMWSNSDQLITAAIPDSSDLFLMGYYHSYDPWPFGLQGPGTYGSASDIAATKAKFDQVTSWSVKNNIPVILDEFGYIKACEYNSRMCAYATVVDQALRHGVGTFAWDDGGDFTVFNRRSGTFNEIKDILIHEYPESPNTLKISQVTHSADIILRWHNRDSAGDSIVVQRGTVPGIFTDLASISPTDSVYVDSTTLVGKTYFYRLRILTKDSVEIQSYPIMMNVTSTSVRETRGTTGFELTGNYPNPFNPSTVISYQLSTFGHVTLKVYDVMGREVATLVGGRQSPGPHSAIFDGARFASGVYLYRLVAGGNVATGKMVLVK